MKRYSHLYSVGLTVLSRRSEAADATELLIALERRLQELKTLPLAEVLEAFEDLGDTLEEEAHD